MYFLYIFSVFLKSAVQNKYCVLNYGSIYTAKSRAVVFWLVAHLEIFRLFMKAKFDAYVLWPLARVQNWIEERSTARNFAVKFGLSEKNTKFEKIFLIVLTNHYLHNIPIKLAKFIYCTALHCLTIRLGQLQHVRGDWNNLLGRT